eukprot:5861797-Amphidinium_carterae.1
MKSECRHEQAATCAQFFNSAPLMASASENHEDPSYPVECRCPILSDFAQSEAEVTADLECHIIFWSLLPLRPYDFFSSAEVETLSAFPMTGLT